jgi:SET domain-containing protein
MLHVQAHAGVSRIHGIGLFAAQFIPAGTIIWRFQPGFDLELSIEDLDRLTPVAQRQVRQYAYSSPAGARYLLSSDDDRFTNHSEEPNTHVVDGCTVASRDIEPGEEITTDYREFGMTLPRDL